MTKLKINEHCSVRIKAGLYCLTDLYKFMDMRSDRSSPQYWATNRAGLVLVQKGFFRKTYWAPASVLADYAESLTPGIAKEVRAALGVPNIPSVSSIEKGLQKSRKEPTNLDTLLQSMQTLEVVDKPLTRIQHRTDDEVLARAVAQLRTRSVPPARPATRGGSSSRSRSMATSRHDDMMTQAVMMNQIMSEPSRSHSSHHSHSASDTCRSPSYSSSHSSSHSHSHDSSSSYDSGSSSSDSGGGGCD
jgi:hypothetical protein